VTAGPGPAPQGPLAASSDLGPLRAHAGAIFDAALAAGDVRPLVRRALAGTPPPRGRFVVVGAGKASGAMAAAAEEALGDAVGGGLVVVKDGYEPAADGIAERLLGRGGHRPRGLARADDHEPAAGRR